ncbi:MAG: dihydrolipoamide acetyltransferase family protein [Myxococcales bacterium]|jgi:pyruvate dehydrogenase E2 component (dihydrolipoamide acetyltransferase)
MSRLKFKLPDIGEGVTEGEIVQWFVSIGDTVHEDDPMVEILTDKATVTIGAPCDARIAQLHFDPGSVAKVGQAILTLEPLEGSTPRSSKQSSRPAASAVGDIQDRIPGASLFVSHPHDQASERDEHFQPKPLATPATRRLAKELGVDLRQVRATGDGGRVTAQDVRAASSGEKTDEQPPEALEERRPIIGIRRKIAERMSRSKRTAAHFTFVEECQVDRLVDLRDRLGDEASKRGVRLTYLPFIVKAVAHALHEHPALNAVVDEERQEIVYKKYYDIGVATATDAGLVVPVVRGADRLRLFELARQIDRLSESARQGTVPAEDLRGSTFTVTSLGKRSGLLATPILNHPEVGILGVHRIKERPVVRDGHVVVGKIMLLSLSFDHRVVDGHVGAAFAYEVIETLENPERLFYELL